MKRKLFALVLTASIAISLVGCGSTKSVDEYPKDGLMTIVDKTNGYRIYVHDETGVMYFCVTCGSGSPVCVMLDGEGKPLIYDGR